MAVQLTVCLVILMFLELSVSQQNSECINIRSGNSDGCWLTVRTNEECRQWSPLCDNSWNDLSSLCEGFSADGISTTQTEGQGTATTVTVYEKSTPTISKEWKTTVTTTKHLAPSVTMEYGRSQPPKILVTVTTTVRQGCKDTQQTSINNHQPTMNMPLQSDAHKECEPTTTALGVLTGILLVSLVMVIAGWVWTCARTRSNHTAQTLINEDHSVIEADFGMEQNQSYSTVTRSQESEHQQEEIEHIYEN